VIGYAARRLGVAVVLVWILSVITFAIYLKVPADPAGFLAYAEQWPTHSVRLFRTGSGQDAEWAASPWQDAQAYRLTFNLPERVESWISENEEWRGKRTSAIKKDLLPYITVYRRAGEDMRVYQLRYEPGDLRRPRP